MVYSILDLKHLSVMSELEEKDVVKKVEYYIPTTEENILVLCEKLRTNKFEKYANLLEEKFLSFEKEASEMYKVHNETGDDLVNAAHPNGDVEMGKASDELGEVETILSKHNKIVDVVNKQPTGKLATYIKQCKMALGDKGAAYASKKAQASQNIL